MGFFVKINGTAGYAQGFMVFLVLAVLSLVLFSVLHRYAPIEENATSI
jgi:hypothetical protein